jgi:hypothetical protein
MGLGTLGGGQELTILKVWVPESRASCAMDALWTVEELGRFDEVRAENALGLLDAAGLMS